MPAYPETPTGYTPDAGDATGTGGLPAYAGDETQWDDNISLHGPDTFYNWEQDNIPLIQLANRTAWLYYALEGQTLGGSNLGYGGPGGDLPGVYRRGSVGASVNLEDGVVLTLSSTADRTKGIYSNMQRLLSNVPRKLKHPLTIEICKYGDLGALNLHGITCEGTGALEIVNRCAAIAHGGLSGTTAAALTEARTVSSVSGVGRSFTKIGPSQTKETTHLLKAMPITFSSTQLWADISGASSVKGISCYVSGSWNVSGRCLLVQHPVANSKSPAVSLHVAASADTTPVRFIGDGALGGLSPVFSAGVFNASANDLSISAYDAVPVNCNGLGRDSFHEDTSNYTAWAADSRLHAVAYGNYFSKVSIRDCHGDNIKLKNIMVDSGEGHIPGTDLLVHNAYHEAINGFEIVDSEVTLESTASIRNSYAGYSLNNSKVRFNKGAIAYRNYPLIAGGTRSASDTSLYEAGDPKVKDGVGLYARNSIVVFDTETDSASPAGSYYTSSVLPGYYPYYFGESGIGIYAKGSYIGGGSLGTVFAQGDDSQTSKLIAANNTNGGFCLENSTLAYKGIPWAYLNEGYGVYAVGSTIKTTGLIAEFNEGNGLHLVNSDYQYGFGGSEVGSTLRANSQRLARGTRTSTVTACTNGNHNIKICKGSSFHPEKFLWMAGTYGEIGGNGTNRTMTTSGGTFSYFNNVPMVSVDENSYGEFISFGAEVPFNASLSSTPTRGSAASVTNGSTATFIGTSSLNTLSYRSGSLAAAGVGREFNVLNAKASFYAGKNSTLRLSGPTKISGLGIGVLGEDNSNVEFGPVIDKDNGYVDVANYDLSTGTVAAGHTKVDVHALRSCVVVNKGSNLTIKNLGGSATPGTEKNAFSDTSSVDSLAFTDALLQSCTSGGYFQFHPNGFTDMILSSTYLAYTNIGSAASTRTGTLGAQTGTSTGGMCVRAVGNSIVDVNAVNFPMGAFASSVSGVYYNIEGLGREHSTGYAGLGGNGNAPAATGGAYRGGSQIYIWNIADTSRIHAANLLVSGVAPSSVGGGTGADYHGPAGKWFNGVGLDYYGADGAAGYSAIDVTLASYENNGPFRLMFGTRGIVKSYFDLSGDTLHSVGSVSATGGAPIDQVNGQGYMAQVSSVSALPWSDSTYSHQYENAVSGDVVFGAYKNASSIPDNYIGTAGNGLVSVPVIHGEWQGYMRNFLDESAANTFANAKHSSNERVGFVSLYNSNTNSLKGGEGRDVYESAVTFGKGVRSLNLFDLDRLV